jgi:NAD(P)-dependent dehydrogenase (short-subunit alcohol dehydrogenase family)
MYKRTFDAATKAFGRLDILVNNAGTNIRKQPQDYTLEECTPSSIPT